MELATYEIVEKCCCCGKVKVEQGWSMNVIDGDPLYSHVCCPQCEKKMMAQFGLYAEPTHQNVTM